MKGFGFSAPAKGFRSSSLDRVFSPQQVVEAAFRHFRDVGFPFRPLPLHTCYQEVNKLSSTSNDTLLETTMGIRTADTYHPHRFQGRHHSKKWSPLMCFENDEFLVGCLEKTLELEGSIKPDFIDGLRYYRGCKSCSNFRPGFALFLYRKFCEPGATVLDTSMGFGGRLVGFLASECGTYIGVDPSTDVCRGNKRMVSDFGKTDKVELYCLPAEDVDHSVLDGRCDFAFTSPPYFRTEVYSDEDTQSCHRYKTGELWRDRFLFPLMRLHYTSLKPGSFSCMNIADVRIGTTTYPLVDWTVAAAVSAGFVHKRTKHYKLRRLLGSGGDGGSRRTEPVLVFRKEKEE